MKSNSQYKVSTDTGFLINSFYKVKLPFYYHPWEEIQENLETFIEDDTLEYHIAKLQFLDINQLIQHNYKLQAHTLLAMISSVYVWHKGPNAAKKVLPKQLAVPLRQLSNELGLQPILCHVNLVLGSSTVKLPVTDVYSHTIWMENTVIPNRNWVVFQRETARIELAFAPVISAVYSIYEGIKKEEDTKIIEALGKVKSSVIIMRKCLENFNEMDSDFFHVKMRPFLVGWTDGNFVDKRGLGYETVDGQCDYFHCIGGSAGQSPTFQVLDRLFNVQHSPKNQIFFDAMKDYMLKEHQEFLDDIQKHIKLNKYVIARSNAELTNAFNECINEISLFRSFHICVVTKFVINPSERVHEKEKSEFLQEKGTGGQDLKSFLKEVRDDVKEKIIEKN